MFIAALQLQELLVNILGAMVAGFFFEADKLAVC